MKTLLLILALWASLVSLCNVPDPNKTYKIEYEVHGISGAKSANLTYTNESGGTEQREVMLPWSRTLTVPGGTFLYLSAQNKQEQGSITANILSDGTTRKTSTSDGAYVIATVSYHCCD